MSSRRNELAEKAVLVLATAWVLLGGAATSVFLIVSGSTSPTETLLTFAGCSALAGFVLWLLQEPDPTVPRGTRFRWFRRQKSETIRYRLQVRKTVRSPDEPPPQPPSVERIRQLADEGLNTWVPNHVPDRKRPHN